MAYHYSHIKNANFAFYLIFKILAKLLLTRITNN